MKKTVAAVLLAMTMTVAFAGCGSDGKDKTAESGDAAGNAAAGTEESAQDNS